VDEDEGDEEKEEEEEDDNEEPQECSVCLQELTEGDGEISTLACGHAFHGDCLDCWEAKCGEKMIAKTCPYCRQDISRIS
jgi:hypothetical protein